MDNPHELSGGLTWELTGTIYKVKGPDYSVDVDDNMNDCAFGESLKEAQATYWANKLDQAERDLIDSTQTVQDLKPVYDAAFDVFLQNNAELIESLGNAKDTARISESVVKTAAEELYKLGVTDRAQYAKVVEKTAPYEYDEEKAMEWAKVNMPVAIEQVLDRKVFESYGGIEKLDFVTVKDKIPTAQIARKKVEEALNAHN